jgi:two-component system, OmpR family, copper resistance phosphate regulon response regulator CusR
MRILLIEDDSTLSASIAKHLRAESFAVDIAGDGKKGEEFAHINEYDVILLDIMLPHQDGWTTCKNLRRMNVLTPILMLTALDDVNDKIRGLDSGADDYLPKPFHIGELLARLRALARRRTDVRTTDIEHYGLRLDIATHRAYREGNEIFLTSKEFALLELFMMHPGKILSREVISEHLWDMNFEPRSNIIESFVRFLRQKIDKGFDTSLIQTVRGAGYIFSNEKE